MGQRPISRRLVTSTLANCNPIVRTSAENTTCIVAAQRHVVSRKALDLCGLATNSCQLAVKHDRKFRILKNQATPQEGQVVTQDPTHKKQNHGQVAGGSFINTPSTMWATPFVASLSHDITFMSFTVTVPLLALTKRVLPSTVTTSWERNKSVDKTFRGTTW